MQTAVRAIDHCPGTIGLTTRIEGLEEVVVTAQKRAQSIQDVPISITAFSGDFLEETGVQTIEDVAFSTELNLRHG